MSRPTVRLAPIFMEIDGCMVELLESSELTSLSGEKNYLVSLRINYKGIKSKTFMLPASDIRDLTNKIKIEISKLKFFEMTMGMQALRRLIE